MPWMRVPSNPPERVKRAAECFAQACVDEGWFGYTELTCYGGEVTTAWNNETRFEKVEGEWFKAWKKEGGR